MATEGPYFPASVATQAGASGVVDWTTPTNALTDNTTNAQWQASALGEFSYELKVYDFQSFATVGDTDTITDLKVVIDLGTSGAAKAVDVVQLGLLNAANFTLVSDNKAGLYTGANSDQNVAGTAQQPREYSGTVASYWNVAGGLTGADIKGANFGVLLQLQESGGTAQGRLDYISLEITYTAGGISINAGVDPLVLAEQQATIGLSIPITAGVDALTLTEHAATVTLDTGINIAAGTDALVLAEQAATVALSIPITAGVDALTITEHAATVGLGVPIEIAANVDALVLAEQAASVGLSMPVVASFDALVLTAYPATIAGGDVAQEIAPQGGHYWPDVERDDWKDRSARERREFLERLINGAEEAPEPVKEEIKEVIAPYQTKGVTSLAVSRSGLARLARNQAAVERLIAVYEQFVDDEDATVLLLVA